MKTADEFENIRGILIRFINKYNALVKNPMDYGTGELLYPSEMHALEAIGKSPGVNVTGIAKTLGVTKGAVSQVIRKLAGKKLIKRLRDEANEKAVLLILDERGKVAMEAHERFHAAYEAEIRKEFADMSREEIAFIRDVFTKLEASVDRYLTGLG